MVDSRDLDRVVDMVDEVRDRDVIARCRAQLGQPVAGQLRLLVPLSRARLKVRFFGVGSFKREGRQKSEFEFSV